MNPRRALKHPLVLILIGALTLRLLLTPLYAYLPNGTLDEGFWKHWMQIIHEDGVLNIFRNSDTDYVGYHWVLWLLAEVYAVTGGPYYQTAPFLHVLVKLPPIAFDLILITTVYKVTKFILNSAPRHERSDRRVAVETESSLAEDKAGSDSATAASTSGALAPPNAPNRTEPSSPGDVQPRHSERSEESSLAEDKAGSDSATAASTSGASAPPNPSTATDALIAPPASRFPLPASRIPAVAATIIALQPGVLYDSAVWAQTDAAIAAAMLGALTLAYRRMPVWAGVVFALGFAVKPHPIIIAPLVVLTLLRCGGWAAAARAATAAAIVMAIVLGPWLLHGDAREIGEVYGTLFGKERQRLSELAWNTWWIPDQQGDPRPGSAVVSSINFITYQRLAFALSGAATALAFTFAWLRRDFTSLLIAAAYQAFAFFQLPIGAHERYLYPFLVLLLPVIFARPRWAPFYIVVSTTFFLNLITVAPPLKSQMDQHVYGNFGQTIAATNTILFVAFTLTLLLQLSLVRTRHHRQHHV